jgi:hypothetical protein
VLNGQDSFASKEDLGQDQPQLAILLLGFLFC